MKHKKFPMVLLAAMSVVSATAQDFDGAWTGVLSFGQQSLRIVFNISGETATLDSPDQGAMRIPATSVRCDAERIEVKAEPLRMTYTGTRTGTQTIEGIFEQNGIRIPMQLTRREPPAENRPQEPQPPYPYAEEEVAFCSAAEGITLHGTLTLPNDSDINTCVVLVSGSGVQNRDEEIFGHKPFRVIADYLTRHGIAVLRYDDREYTSLRYDGATTRDYALDALGAVAYLRSRTDTSAARIGIAGHSEGGTIGFICAADDPQIAFVISLAGMIVPGKDCILAQNRVALRSAMTDEETTELICSALGAAFDEIRTMTPDEVRAQSDNIAERTVATLGDPQLNAALKRNIAESLDGMNEWVLYFLGYDPAESISRVQCPVLALNGARDLQVDADSNLGRLAQFPNLAGRLTTRKFDNLNHLFQHCESGSVAEYPLITETFSDEVLEVMVAWLRAL